MSTFVGEIKMFGGTFIPDGWLACEGQILAINTYPALASILGSFYGGNGTTTFALPDFRGRTLIGTGAGPGLTDRLLGQKSGVETVTLQKTQIPAHNHLITNSPQVQNSLTATGKGSIKCASTAGNSDDPSGAFPAKTKAIGGDDIYTSDGTQATSVMNSDAIDIQVALGGNISVDVSSTCGLTGGNLEHENMQPWICMNYIINWNGVYPNRS